MYIFNQRQFLTDIMNYTSGCGYLKKTVVRKERKIPENFLGMTLDDETNLSKCQVHNFKE